MIHLMGSAPQVGKSTPDHSASQTGPLNLNGSITVENTLTEDAGPSWVSKLPSKEQVGVPDRIVTESKVFRDTAKAHGFTYFDIHPNRNAALESAYETLTGNPHTN